MEEITQDLVKSLFEYKDGILYYKKINGSNHMKIGNKAGTLHCTGYYITKINGKQYKNHRLIYLYHNGFLPEFIDHIDGDRSNNNIKNLRKATQSQNNMNKIKSLNKSSKYKGVNWNKNKWRVRIQINGKIQYLGRFKSEIEAARSYNNKAIELFGEYANLNIIEGI